MNAVQMNDVHIMTAEVTVFKVKNLTLLIIAAAVWLAAGVNIARIGVEEYALGYVNVINLVLSVVVGVVFWFMAFYKLTVKHTKRIAGYGDERQLFVKFFDVRSFVIMAVMMSGGIAIRALHLLPDVFIAVFYTGLGSALALAGLVFAVNFFRVRKGAFAACVSE